MTLVSVVAIAALLITVVVSDRTPCPSISTRFSRIQLADATADVVLEGGSYTVSARALLDQDPVTTSLSYRPPEAPRHRLTISATISAQSREALGQPEIVCIRATQGADAWSQRPTTYPTQTMADGYPPGAPSPSPNVAWRRAIVRNGPMWQAGSKVDLELWLTLRGRRYIVDLPPVVLVEGS